MPNSFEVKIDNIELLHLLQNIMQSKADFLKVNLKNLS